MKKNEPSPVQCPHCRASLIPHRTFISTRVADYSAKRFERYYRCGPMVKDQPHTEHEWMVKDIRAGQFIPYAELHDCPICGANGEKHEKICPRAPKKLPLPS
jgi:hypothetical protein